NSLDETLALPTEEAVRLALRTQQIIAHETGVADVIDPFGGSYFVESLTDQLEREAEALFAEIQSVGGVVKGIESGWFQRQIARPARRVSRRVVLLEARAPGQDPRQVSHQDQKPHPRSARRPAAPGAGARPPGSGRGGPGAGAGLFRGADPAAAGAGDRAVCLRRARSVRGAPAPSRPSLAARGRARAAGTGTRGTGGGI